MKFKHIRYYIEHISSNSTCSICCTTSCTANPQLFDFSTNPQHFDMSSCCGFVVDSTTNRSSGVWFSTRPQQVEKLCYKSKSCTTNPQQIEQVEFELYGLENSITLPYPPRRSPLLPMCQSIKLYIAAFLL
jgi:hypothetical protein